MGSKRSKDGNSGQIDGVDRISSLPNSILAHILSFLPTKEAVASSLLSSGWRFLWKQVPAIDVDQEAPFNDVKRASFCNFINNLLLLNNEPCLRYCRLIFPFHTEAPYANAWIKAISTREVMEMHLEILDKLEFPFCVFTCKKLITLTLSTYGMLKVPTYVHLPNLRIINLIDFSIQDGSFLRLLTSGCPVLQALVIECCTFHVGVIETNFYVCSTTLKKLQLKQNYGFVGALAVIDAPSLEYLMISDSTMFKYDISGLSRLKEADISLWGYGSRVYDISKLINSIASSTTIRLRQLHFEDDIQDLLSDQLLAFSNLTFLELEIAECCCCFLPVILQRTPNLLNLILKFETPYIFDHLERSGRSHVFHVPSCLLYSIKVIEIQKFNGCKGAMETVSYLLMNAKVLNEMKICCSPKLLLEEKMKRNLLSFTRASCTCRVSICSSS